MMEFPPAFFVTGTDTGIGKTFVSAVLLKGLNGSYWKPVQSGITANECGRSARAPLQGVPLPDELTDTEWVKAMTGLPDERFFEETYRLNQPLSPHASAKIEGVRIDLSAFRLPNAEHGPLIVEGAGGVLVPLNERALVLDLIEHLNLPVLVVARSTLGTINHTLLTLGALRSRKLDTLGVVLNGPPNEGNKQAIEEYGNMPVIACIPPMGTGTPDIIEKAFEHFAKRHHEQSISDLASIHADENRRHAAAGALG